MQNQNNLTRWLFMIIRALSSVVWNYCATQRNSRQSSNTEYFHLYLFGRKSVVRTGLASYNGSLDSDLNQGLEKLYSTDFMILHRSAHKWAKTDALSREPHWEMNCKHYSFSNGESFSVSLLENLEHWYLKFMVCILPAGGTQTSPNLKTWSATIFQNYATLPFALTAVHTEWALGHMW